MYVIFAITILVLVAALTGFIFVQVKAGLYWRLVSIVFLVVFCSWATALFYGGKYITLLGEYSRDSREIVESMDQLATEGRTNDVHQISQKFEDVFVGREVDLTNLDRVVEDAENRVSPLPFTLTKP